MSSAILAESYDAAKLEEYIRFVEHLGPNVQFHENKWLCSNLRRSAAAPQKKAVRLRYTLAEFQSFTKKR